MHIIISILKIAGISVIVIILLLIFLLILFLFVPFRYQLYGCVPKGISDETCSGRRNTEAKVTVRFLAFLLAVSLEYTEKKVKGAIRILGVPVKRIGEEKAPKKKKEKKKKAVKTAKKTAERTKKDRKEQAEGNTEKPKEEKQQVEVQKQQKEQKQQVEVQKQQIEEQEQQIEEQKQQQREQVEQTKDQKQEKENRTEKDEKENREEREEGQKEEQKIHKKSWFDFPKRFFQKLYSYVQSFSNIWKKLCDAKKRVAEVWRNEHVQNGLSTVWKQCRRGLLHIMPRSFYMRLHFGCSDPAATGQILGALSILYAFYGDNVKIEPEFEQTAFDGEVRIRGQFQLFFLLRIAWTLYKDKEIRYALEQIKGIREKKEKAEEK